jgi:hypothetical protein
VRGKCWESDHAESLPRGERRGEWLTLILRAFLIGDLDHLSVQEIAWESSYGEKRYGVVSFTASFSKMETGEPLRLLGGPQKDLYRTEQPLLDRVFTQRSAKCQRPPHNSGPCDLRSPGVTSILGVTLIDIAIGRCYGCIWIRRLIGTLFSALPPAPCGAGPCCTSPTRVYL